MKRKVGEEVATDIIQRGLVQCKSSALIVMVIQNYMSDQIGQNYTHTHTTE